MSFMTVSRVIGWQCDTCCVVVQNEVISKPPSLTRGWKLWSSRETEVGDRRFLSGISCLPRETLLHRNDQDTKSLCIVLKYSLVKSDRDLSHLLSPWHICVTKLKYQILINTPLSLTRLAIYDWREQDIQILQQTVTPSLNFSRDMN